MNKIEQDRTTRFDFLLSQTEIFSHFINTGRKSKGPKSPLKMKPQDWPTPTKETKKAEKKGE